MQYNIFSSGDDDTSILCINLRHVIFGTRIMGSHRQAWGYRSTVPQILRAKVSHCSFENLLSSYCISGTMPNGEHACGIRPQTLSKIAMEEERKRKSMNRSEQSVLSKAHYFRGKRWESPPHYLSATRRKTSIDGYPKRISVRSSPSRKEIWSRFFRSTLNRALRNYRLIFKRSAKNNRQEGV